MSSLPPSSAPYSDPFADKLTIETPEQTALEFDIAGVGSRFLALALDTLISNRGHAGFRHRRRGHFPHLASLFLQRHLGARARLGASFLIFIGYFAIFEAVWNGQTPGKRIIRIRVIKDTGRPIAPYEAVARNLLRLVDQMPGILYGVGIVSALLSRQNKRLGDFVAGTIVVHEQELQDFRPLWQTPAATPTTVSYGAEATQRRGIFLGRKFSQSPQCASARCALSHGRANCHAHQAETRRAAGDDALK